MEVLDPIPIVLDVDRFGKEVHVKRTGAWEPFQSAVEMARRSIAPKAAYAIRYVEARTDDGVVIDGVCFTSRILRKNLEHVSRVFPYIVSIGPVLEEKAGKLNDMIEKYYLDAIGNTALIQAREYLEETLRSKFGLDGLSFMSPGSLEDWPIEQQRRLFSLFEAVECSICVTLTENCLMIPKKSVSGIYFPTETTFYNCQLCPRERCVGRKAPYSSELAGKYGVSK